MMSEQEQEPIEPEPEPELEPTPEEQEEDEQTEPEPTPEAEPEPVAEPGETDADVEAVYRRLDTKAKNYTKGLADVLADSNVPVAGCEMCSDCYPGIRWIEPQDEIHATLLAVVGASTGGSPLNEDPDAILCERCNGFGWTKLPSHVPGNEQRLCKNCNGAGWLDRHEGSGAPVAPTPAAQNGGAEPLPGVPENDPSVVDLRARGFTVIPPMQIQGAGEQA